MSPFKGMKINTQQKMVAQNMSVYGTMFRRRSDVSTKFIQIKLCQIIRSHQTCQAKAEESFEKHPQLNQILSSLHLAVVKVQVIEKIASTKQWSAAPRSATRGQLTLRTWLSSQPPKTYIPSTTSHHTDACPMRAVGAVPLGDS